MLLYHPYLSCTILVKLAALILRRWLVSALKMHLAVATWWMGDDGKDRDRHEVWASLTIDVSIWNDRSG